MTVIISLLAALTMAAPQQVPGGPPTDPTRLDDVEVTAEARVDMAREFVGRVAAPARRRGLGRWKSVCPAVANFEPAAARDIANRIAGVAHELGIDVGKPGCTANIVIAFTDEAQAVAQRLAEAEPRVYHVGVGALNRGGAALRDYQTSDRPVRWWLMSVPIDSETGQRAIRIPGDRTSVGVDKRTASMIGCSMPDDCVIGAAPIIMVQSASRLSSQIVDQIYKAIVIVDIEQVSGLNTAQLGDYLTLVTLAQIDPEAGTEPFDTVLNLFDAPNHVAGLTAWDEAYLRALYDSPSRRRSPGAQAAAVAGIMNRALGAEARSD